jgi:predicted  nucleic acid-binding Zn-ribbon protein
MHQAQRLYELQKVDSQLDAKSQRLAEVEESLGDTEVLRSARQVVANTEQAVAALQSELRELELEIKSVRAKLEQNQNRLYGGRVRNPKELSSLQDEAEALRRRVDSLEEDQLELMIGTEDEQAQLHEQRAHLDAVEGDWQEDQSRLRAEREALIEELAELRQERQDRAQRIEVNALDTYEHLRARFGGVAVALMKEEVCQACGVAMSFSRAQRVYQGEELVQCGACSRLLFGRR